MVMNDKDLEGGSCVLFQASCYSPEETEENHKCQSGYPIPHSRFKQYTYQIQI
jgi:hypothetical protein